MEFIDIITMHLTIYNNSKSTENNIKIFDNLHHVGIFVRPKGPELNTLLRGHKFYNVGRGFNGHNKNAFSFF